MIIAFHKVNMSAWPLVPHVHGRGWNRQILFQTHQILYVQDRLHLVVNLCYSAFLCDYKKLAVSPERYRWPGECSGPLETKDRAAGTYVPVD